MLAIIYIYIVNLYTEKRRQMIKVKVKLTLLQAMKTQRGSRSIDVSFSLTSALDSGWCLTFRRRNFLLNFSTPCI